MNQRNQRATMLDHGILILTILTKNFLRVKIKYVAQTQGL